ncbi:MAG TPA: hypothetical protein VN114_06660, partial [Oxalicibacterium sp.]|uniref:hypothetical protein n=1 Tax=Oxalicibacterium sp. TaxID=2766525 RepID=UPI002CB1CD5B
ELKAARWCGFFALSRALDRQNQIGRSNEELIFFEEISGIIRHVLAGACRAQTKSHAFAWLFYWCRLP